MAQWGIVEDWADYYAGRRATPPSTPLAPGTERAARFAAYCVEHGIARVTR